MDWILRLSLRSAYGVHNFLENTKFQECVWSAWILVCKWSPGSAFGVRTFQQKKMWECVGVRRSALKDSQVRLECALLTHCYALQTHFSTARDVSRTRAHSPGVRAAILASGVARQKRQSKLGLWNSLCTTEPTLLEVIKWVSKVHYAHIQLDDEATSNIVYWAMKSRAGSVDAYPIPCNLQFQLQQTNHSQDLWHQVDLLRYRVNHSIFYTCH